MNPCGFLFAPRLPTQQLQTATKMLASGSSLNSHLYTTVGAKRSVLLTSLTKKSSQSSSSSALQLAIIAQFSCGTKAFADYIYKHVKQALPDLPVLYYSRDTPVKKKEEDLADVNSSWVQCNLLLYTSTLLVGVSKNITCVQAFSVWTVCVHVMFTSKLNCIPGA